MRSVIATILLSSLSLTVMGRLHAQQAVPGTPPSQASKDRKDYLLEALESQRNDAQAKLAFCYADANEQIARLSASLTDLNGKLATATKEAEIVKGELAAAKAAAASAGSP
jgi:hypothetical protein